MKLILVRHGQTEFNKKQLFQGHSDSNLTDLGKKQAQLVGERLKDEHIDKIIVSDLQRTIDTAQQIIKYHPDVEVVYEPRIRERKLGEFEGKHISEIKSAVQEQNVAYHEFIPDGGESITQHKEKLLSFLDELFEEHFGKTVVLVSHGGVIKNLIMHGLGKDDSSYPHYQCKNCSVSVIELDEQKQHRVHLYFCTKHLDHLDEELYNTDVV